MSSYLLTKNCSIKKWKISGSATRACTPLFGPYGRKIYCCSLRKKSHLLSQRTYLRFVFRSSQFGQSRSCRKPGKENGGRGLDLCFQRRVPPFQRDQPRPFGHRRPDFFLWPHRQKLKLTIAPSPIVKLVSALTTLLCEKRLKSLKEAVLKEVFNCQWLFRTEARTLLRSSQLNFGRR